MEQVVVHEARGAGRRFLGVREVAAVLGVDAMTVYRAIAAGQFPAVRIRGRYVIPSRVVDELEQAAVTTGAVVDPARWALGREPA